MFSYYNMSHSVSFCSYAEVRAEQRRELGIEESNPEANADKVSFHLCRRLWLIMINFLWPLFLLIYVEVLPLKKIRGL